MQKKEVGSLPYTIYKTNSKWIIGLNVKAETMQFMKVNLCDLGLGNGHLKNSNQKINKEILL